MATQPTATSREQLPQETRRRFVRDAARVMEQLGSVVLERFTELMNEAAPLAGNAESARCLDRVPESPGELG